MRSAAVSALPVVWLALALLIFGLHKPWWPYYYIHTAIPFCWCAAVGLHALFKTARSQRGYVFWVLLGLYTVLAAPWLGARLYFQVAGIRHFPQTYNTPVLREIDRLKPSAHFMYADDPIYSFHAGIPLPPDLALLTLKRFWAGDMTNDRLTTEISEIKPEIILLKNDGRQVPFQRLLEDQYRLIYLDVRHRLYAAKGLTTPPVLLH